MTWRRLTAALLLVVLAVSDVAAAMEKIASYREPPYGACRFIADQFHVELDAFQEEAAIAFCDPLVRRISLQAAAGVGKSAIMAMLAWYFLAVQCLDEWSHPKGLVTGVTDANLRDNFWSELRRWQAVSPWLSAAFTHTDRSVFANGYEKTWFLGRRNWPKGGNPDEQGATLSGLHAKSVAAFIDESGAIPGTVLRAAEQALADNPPFGKIFQSGNPISLEGMLYLAATKLRSQWRVIRVTNDPDDPKRAKRGDIEWARQQIQLYGRDNPWVQSYILGQFPASSLNTLLSIEDVNAALERHLQPDDYEHTQRRLGIDAARFGDDKWVIFPRQGLRAFNAVDMRNPRTHEVVARVVLAKTRWESEREFFDDTGGYAAGVIDGMLQAGYAPTGINFSGKADDPRYFNKRAEMHFRAAQWVKRGGRLPSNCPELVDELVTPTYTFINGQFRIEEKDQIKKRLGRSPNYADALALTFAEADAPRALQGLLARHRETTKARTDYDAYASGGER